MNTLFIIGNGFDLNLNMPTSYHDFYKYYILQKSSTRLIQKLKEEINGNIKNWSDLELALGQYTKNLSNSEEFNEVYNDIEDKLADYLELVEKKYDFSKVDGNKLFKYLVFPENSLPQADRNRISDFRQKWINHQWNIHIITFNYTRTLEKLLVFKGQPFGINEFYKHVNTQVILHKIEHIHGFYNERMVMGVNDVSQIANNEFHNNLDIIETLVKSECNQAQKHTIDDWCKNQIPNSHLICIFGSSIGDTDNLWWELIGEHLKRNCRLIIFEKVDPIPTRRPQKGKIAERKIKKYFLDKTKLSPDEKEVCEKNVFVGINTNMFEIL